jgi:hypothetical protein
MRLPDSKLPLMSALAAAPASPPGRSRLTALLEHFAYIQDPRDVRRILHPLREVLLLVVCATIADCDDYDAIADWGAAHLDFLRRHLPYRHGVPGGRWLTILMNRINPALFSAAFTAWVREIWLDRPGVVAIDCPPRRRLGARPHAAATTGPPARRRCIWSPPSPPPAVWCLVRRRCPTKPTS